jgi:hypothetical protein
MGRLEGYQKALLVHEGLHQAAKKAMVDMRKCHKFSWWARPAYWKASNTEINQFRKTVVARTKIATTLKESGK